jgi:transcriptional regulator with XRE-family HTH domain
MQHLDRARMRELRETAGLSQTEAAEKAGMTVSHWNDIESGRRSNVTIEKLATIAAALGVDARNLLTPAPAPKGKRKG